MNSGPIEDRLAIRELVEQFAAGAMRIDVDYWGETFAEDGSWKLPSMETAAVGREAVKAAFSQKLAYVDYMSMISFPADLVVEGDRARGKAYCRELIFTKAGDQKIVIGCFNDEYVKIQGRWYFQSREYQVMGVH
jgi:hypothetical protein